MSTISFPDNPSLGELYPFGGKTWQWNGNYWGVYSSGITITDITYSSTTGNLNITKSDASSLTAGTWTYIYDGSYNTSSREITLSANTGGTITISNLDYNGVTDLNYNIPTRILSISRPSGPDSVDLSSLIGNLVYSGSYNSNTGVVTFYPVSGDSFTVSGFLTGYTNTYTTGFTYNPDSGLIQFNRTDLQNAYSGFTAYVVSGDSNYLVKYNSTGTTESIIYDNGTNVGINTISPSYLLDVNGNTRFRNFVGIGPSGTSSTYGIWNSLPFSGSSSTFYGISNDSLISSATTNAISYHSTLGLNDFSATNANITHYLADQKTFTTNRGITNHIGYRVSSLLTGTTVYGFYGDVAGTNTTRWNLYMPGSANNFLQGKLLVGNSGASVANATFEKPISTTNGSTSLFQAGSIQGSMVTAYGIRNQLIMSASSTVNTYIHISAAQGIIGSGAVLGSQYGFSVGSDFISGSTNIAYYSAVNSGTSSNWNLYIIGTAPNYIAGRIGFGNTSITNINMRLQRVIDGGTSAYGLFQGGFVQSSVQAGYGINNTLNAGSTNTLSNYYHFNAVNGTVNPITGMSGNYGYYAHANLVYTGATNNYGFYGNLAASSVSNQNWNIYMNGTAPNYLAGDLRIGSNENLGYKLHVRNGSATSSSLVAGTVAAFESSAATFVSVVSPDTFNSGISFGSASDRLGALIAWNYTAKRLFIGTDKPDGYISFATGEQSEKMVITTGGTVGIGTLTPNSKSILDLTSTSQGFLPPRMTNVQITGITSPPEGLTIYSTDAKTLVFYNGTSWQKVTTTTL